MHVEKKSEKGEGAGEATHHLVGLLGDSTRLLHRGMYIAGMYIQGYTAGT